MLNIGDSVEIVYKNSFDTGRVGILVPRTDGGPRGYMVDHLDGTVTCWTFSTSLKRIEPLLRDEYEQAVKVLGEEYFA